jgi:hypothetical protein
MMIDNSPIFITTDTVTGKSGQVYPSSQFKIVKFLTLGEKADASRLMDIYTNNIKSIKWLDIMSELAVLKFHIKAAPTWWVNDGLNILDEEPIREVSRQIQNAVKPPEIEEKKTEEEKPEKTK